MTPETSLLPTSLLIGVIAWGFLALIFGLGWLLVPGSFSKDHKLLRLTLILTAGLLVLTGGTATVCLGRMSYFMLFLVVPVAGSVVWHRLLRGRTFELATERWTRLEMVSYVLICTVAAWLLQSPYTAISTDGRVLDLHSDLGYFVELVISLPEMKAANGWIIQLGEHGTAGFGTRDTWYHWGPVFLGVAVRGATGIPAFSALLGVVNVMLSVLLITSAGAVAGCLWRAGVARLLLAGVAAITAVQLLKLSFTYHFLSSLTGGSAYHYMRIAVGQLFSYKYEGVIFLTMLAVWLRGQQLVAFVLLFLAGISAPHAVATFCAAGGVLFGMGVLLRDREMWRTGAGAVGALLAAWVLMSVVFRTSAPKGDEVALVQWTLADLLHTLRGGAVDTMITLVLGALSLPGIIHLIRNSEQDETGGRARLLGWAALGAIIGGNLALNALHRVVDRFHIIYMAHALLVMPAGMWGALRMIKVHRGPARTIGLAAAVAGMVMGAYDIHISGAGVAKTPWKENDLQVMRDALDGRPAGYFAKEDRPWWISKHGTLGALVGSRFIRLNPIDESKDPHSRFYGAMAPFKLLPPGKEESSTAWALRLAEKLNVRHVIETPEDRLPRSLAHKARLVVRSGALTLYELPDHTTPSSPPTMAQGR